MNYRKEFIVEPSSTVRLDRIDPAFKGKHESHAQAMPEIAKHVERMDQLQYLLYADGDQSLLVVLQALDAGGKDGVVRHLFSGMNPQGTTSVGFKQPSKVEAAHDFLWRAHLRAPGKGELVIFNRSHYEDVLVVRVHKLAPKSVWSKRYALINDFEKTLSANGTRILKFFLHISPEEQLARFRAREATPYKKYKITDEDYRNRDRWDDYVAAVDEMVARTSTERAPWHLVPANDKRVARLEVLKQVTKALERCLD
jgi:PPK2 family polyphosphate:nucleotide phosphotransferase